MITCFVLCASFYPYQLIHAVEVILLYDMAHNHVLKPAFQIAIHHTDIPNLITMENTSRFAVLFL